MSKTRRLFLLTGFGWALLGASCSPTTVPPAQTPVLDAVLDRVQPERPALVAEDGSAFGVLPRTSVMIRVRAPWPATLVVRVNGVELNRVAWSDSSPVPNGGRFAFDVVDPNPSPPLLLVRVDLPSTDRQKLRTLVEIASQSSNPQNPGQSAWLPVTLTRTHEALEMHYATLITPSLTTNVSLTPQDRLVIVARELPKTLSGGTNAGDIAPSLVHASLIYRIGQGPWRQGARSTAPGNATRGSQGNIELAFNLPPGTAAPRQLTVWMLVWRMAGVPANDPDDDLLTDAEEAALGTNPLNANTDGDDLIDGLEVRYGTDPLNNRSDFRTFISGRGGRFSSPNICAEGVGYPPDNRCVESDDGTDTDGDGLHDVVDLAPSNADRDGDGLNDGFETGWGTPRGNSFGSGSIQCYEDRGYRYSSPNFPDSDWDGLSDGEEIFRWGSDPGLVDLDRDWILDPEEVMYRTNPRQFSNPPPGVVRVPTGNRVPDC